MVAQVLSQLGELSPIGFGSTIKKFCEICKDLTSRAYEDRMPSLKSREDYLPQELSKLAQEDLREFLKKKDPTWSWKELFSVEVGQSGDRKVFKVKGRAAGEQREEEGRAAGEQGQGEGDGGGRPGRLRWCLCCSSRARVASEDAAAQG